MSDLAERLYSRCPVSVQNLACSWYGWREKKNRLGHDFERTLDELTASQWWSREEIGAYQDEQLRSLVKHAYENVPFYRERMREHRLTPADIRSRDDLPKLPILTKEDVRLHGAGMLATNASARDMVGVHTSGTTGKALDFQVTRRSITTRWAVWWRHRRRFGVDLGDWHANFTGKRVVPPDQEEPPYWRWNYPMRQMLLNMHHMVRGRVESIARFLSEQNPVYYAGYPSVIHAFAAALIAEGVTLERKPRVVFTGAENMLDIQRRDIAAVTGATMTDQYGFSEGCGNASQCESLLYHEDFEYGILECVDGQENVDGTRGRIIATGFASPAFPFIRYDVGDVGVWARDSFACTCGRHSKVLTRIVGRTDDYVLTPEGRSIMRFDYVFKETPEVMEAQVVQRRLGAIELRVVRRPGFNAHDERHIRKEISRWISPGLEVDFVYVDEIPREANGKFRAVVSLLPGAE